MDEQYELSNYEQSVTTTIRLLFDMGLITKEEATKQVLKNIQISNPWVLIAIEESLGFVM